MPMPATCWLTPIVTVSRPISAPAAAPTAMAAAIAEPQRARLLGGEEAAERPGVHRPLDAEVEHAGPLAEDRPEGAERQRRGDRQHRRQHGRATEMLDRPALRQTMR